MIEQWLLNVNNCEQWLLTTVVVISSCYGHQIERQIKFVVLIRTTNLIGRLILCAAQHCNKLLTTLIKLFIFARVQEIIVYLTSSSLYQESDSAEKKVKRIK